MAVFGFQRGAVVIGPDHIQLMRMGALPSRVVKV
jgi:hypothetical protein